MEKVLQKLLCCRIIFGQQYRHRFHGRAIRDFADSLTIKQILRSKYSKQFSISRIGKFD